MRIRRELAGLLGVFALVALVLPAHAFGRLGCFQAPNVHRPIATLVRVLSVNLTQHLPAENRACNFYARGLLYHLEGDYARAVADYTSAIEWMGSFGDAYAARADAEDDSGQHAQAVADYANARLFSGSVPEELTERCWIRALRGRPLSRALDDCNESLRLEPDDFNALTSRALVYVRMGNHTAAIADCDAALKQKPANATALYIRALAKLRAGDKPGGAADLAAARSASPQVEETFAIYGLKP